jgi:hypothetical protein
MSVARMFGSIAERNDYLTQYFSERHPSEVPGVFSVAAGCISVYDDIILFHDDLAVVMGVRSERTTEKAA